MIHKLGLVYARGKIFIKKIVALESQKNFFRNPDDVGNVNFGRKRCPLTRFMIFFIWGCERKLTLREKNFFVSSLATTFELMKYARDKLGASNLSIKVKN